MVLLARYYFVYQKFGEAVGCSAIVVMINEGQASSLVPSTGGARFGAGGLGLLLLFLQFLSVLVEAGVCACCWFAFLFAFVK